MKQGTERSAPLQEVDVVLLACAGRRGIEDCQRLCGQLEGAGVPLMAVCDYEDREARMLEPVIGQTQTLIEEIQNATGTVELRSIDDR